MPATGNAKKTLASMTRQYGAKKAKRVFYGLINKQRRQSPGSKFLKAIGSTEAKAAASGGHGHEHAKASPFRAKNAPKSARASKKR